jgi:uncharacterized protein (TIGR02646 family)
MIRQERLNLKSLGKLKALGIKALDDLDATGQELAIFLEGYVKNHPESKDWPQWKTRKINHVLFALLCHQTADHCSFCDGYPMTDDMTSETIEHFRPKSGPHARPDLRLTWDNLFACCSGCQNAKRDQWADALLKPDEPDYSFNRYFSCQFTTGKLVPKRRLPEADRIRAEKTIQLYDLNRYATRRLDLFLHQPWYGNTVPLNKKPFRCWMEALEGAKQTDGETPL